MTRVLFLLDESSALAGRVADGTKPKAECYANALNALLAQLAAGPRVEVALVGYRLAADGKQEVGCRWGGSLQARRFVGTSELEAAPLAVEDRVRKIPGPGGYGVAREETVRFPVWYVPLLGAQGSRRSALEYCRSLLLGATEENGSGPRDRGASYSVPPLVIHLLGDLPQEEEFWAVGEVFSADVWPGEAPLLFHVHLGSSGRVPATTYPSSDQNLSPALLRHAFGASSILPDPMASGLRQAGLTLNPGARGLIYNARMVDLIRFLGLVKAYAVWANETLATAGRVSEGGETEGGKTEGGKTEGGMPSHGEAVGRHGDSPEALRPEDMPRVAESTPPAEAEASCVSAASTTLVAFVLDRSCQTPDASGMDPKSPWRRLQDRVNELIGQLVRQGRGAMEVTMLAYGIGPDGQPEVLAVPDDPSPEPAWLRLSELADRTIRVDEFTDQVSNGIGGLLTITRKRPVFFDLAPTPPASPTAVFAKIAERLLQWTAAHPGVEAETVIVHCTRGAFEPGAMREALGQLDAARPAMPSPVLYHVIVTEAAHRAMTYPSSPDGMESDGLRTLWELTGPLSQGDALAGRRPGVSPGARGMVINAVFDVLAEVVGSSK